MKSPVYLFHQILLISSLIFVSSGGQAQQSSIPKEKESQSVTVNKTDEEWKQQLSKEQYYVLRQKGTEAPYSGKLLLNKEKGIYKCAACGNELFTDEMKFDSHCGWPSFDREIAGGKIITHEDNSLSMHRTEILCAKCGGHLGHIFDDGPTETGKRYCVNSLSLEFVPTAENQHNEHSSASQSSVNPIDTLTLGGGCFWCVEAVYEMLDGVLNVESGFSGGKVKNPSYREVCMGNTGHAEVVQITFDTRKTSLEEILKVFFTVHDPTTYNRQGADEGEQYRSVIFYRNQHQFQVSKTIIDELNKNKVYPDPVITQLNPFSEFYRAEDYHQDYYSLNKNKPYCKLVIQPKLEKFEKIFKDKIKKSKSNH